MNRNPSQYFDTSVIINVFGFALFLIIALFCYKYFFINIEYTKKYDKVRCPPNIAHSYKIINNNELNKAHTDNNNIYHINDINNINDNMNGFQSEVIKPKKQIFSQELEDIYTLSSIHDYPKQTNDIIKPNKSDLPIINVPMFILKDNDKPLRLSEKPIS